jgi:hypothetical protein
MIMGNKSVVEPTVDEELEGDLHKFYGSVP